MTAGGLMASPTEGLVAVDEALARTAARFRELVARARLDDADILELALLSANAAHLLTYAEGNQRHLGPAAALRARWEQLFADPEVDAAALALLAGTMCKQPEAERARYDLLDWLRSRADERARPATVQVAATYERARGVLDGIENDQAALLERLGLRTRGAAPAAVFYRAVSMAADPATRGKLVHVWEAQRTRRTGLLLEQLDDIVRIRRTQVGAEDAVSVLDRTLRRSHLDEARAAAFLDAYLERAVDAAGRLAASIRAATRATDNPLDHFGAYAQTIVDGAVLPTLSLDGCLDYLAAVTRDVFGIAFTPLPSSQPHERNVVGAVDGRPVGVATFDLWETPHRGGRTTAVSAGPLATGPGPTTLPAARVLCRHQVDARGERVVSFESVHSMLHEFGHVVNHWLLRRHTPSDVGLDYLPLERIEDLSTWFEKWVYHPRFAEHLALSPRDVAGLAVCARVKRLEFLNANLDRAVVAALDFDVHRRKSGGFADSFHRLDERFDIARLCRLSTVAGYMQWPLCRAYPGANFAYLWGAAFGAQAIAPWLRAERRAPTPSPAAILEPCFDPDAPSEEPDLNPLFRFYDADG